MVVNLVKVIFKSVKIRNSLEFLGKLLINRSRFRNSGLINY